MKTNIRSFKNIPELKLLEMPGLSEAGEEWVRDPVGYVISISWVFSAQVLSDWYRSRPINALHEL